MAPPPRLGWPSLAAILLIFLSLFNIAITSPLPDDHVNNTLVARTGAKKTHIITVEEYENFLKAKWDTPTRYVFYTGSSDKQVKAFIEANPSYVWFSKAFDAVDSKGDEDKTHPWHQFFTDETIDYMDDAEAASEALANLARGDILIFGGLEYATKGKDSFFTRFEIETLRGSFKAGRVKSLNHMKRDALKPSDIAAKEYEKGIFTWIPPSKEGDTNAGGIYGDCTGFTSSRSSSRSGSPTSKRGTGRCDNPTIKPKKKLSHCKRGQKSHGIACPISSKTPKHGTKHGKSTTGTRKHGPKTGKSKTGVRKHTTGTRKHGSKIGKPITRTRKHTSGPRKHTAGTRKHSIGSRKHQ